MCFMVCKFKWWNSSSHGQGLTLGLHIDTEIYYAVLMRIYFEISIKLTFGIKITFPVLPSNLFPYLWAELAPE